MKEILNLRKLTSSGRSPRRGDVFAFSPAGKGFYFGRVVSTDAIIKSMKKCVLIYLFANHSEEKKPPEKLLIGDLLVPPILTNKLPWKEGYFESIENRDFLPGEQLGVNCFFDSIYKKYERYYDECGNELNERFDPCGIYGLNSYKTIDDEVSAALGIPLAKY